jgi:hypothetical protein
VGATAEALYRDPVQLEARRRHGLRLRALATDEGDLRTVIRSARATARAGT